MHDLGELYEQQTALRKIYRTRAIRVATFLGGPIVGGYLIAENFKALGRDRHANITWVVTVLFTVVLLAVVLFVPGIEKMRMGVPVLYSLLAFYIVDNLQGDGINAHLSDGGEQFGWGRIIVISLIGLVITFGLFFGIAFFAYASGLIN